jgi:Tfp pilus assembly protein PilF
MTGLMLGKILLTLMLLQANANAPNGSIRGQILIPSVRASDRIQVLVQRADGPTVARIFSDTTGNYEVRNLPVGTYEVIVNVEGYEEFRQQVGVGANAFSAVNLNILLREKETILIRKETTPADDIVDVTELGRKYPKKAIQEYDKAREEIQKGNDSKVIELLSSAIKQAPDFYAAHRLLGTMYQKARRFSEAKVAFAQAKQLNPRAPEPLINLGSLYIDEAAARAKEGKEVVGKILDDALDILEESLKIKRSAKGYYYLGTAYFRSNFFEEAEMNLKEALNLDPRLGAGHLMLANLYMRQRKWRDASDQLEIYLDQNPQAPDRLDVQGTRTKLSERIR